MYKDFLQNLSFGLKLKEGKQIRTKRSIGVLKQTKRKII